MLLFMNELLLLLLQETCYILHSRCTYYVVMVRLRTVVIIPEIHQQPLTSLKVTIVTNDNYKVFFFRITQYNADAHYAHSPLWTHAHKPYLYEHLQITEPADLEIHKVTTGASLSTGYIHYNLYIHSGIHHAISSSPRYTAASILNYKSLALTRECIYIGRATVSNAAESVGRKQQHPTWYWYGVSDRYTHRTIYK